MSVAVWAAQIRAPFLLLSIILCLIGGAVALVDGVFVGLHFLLCTVGVTLAHVAVNLFNELSDYETGIDDETRPTPFSGGSKTLQRGLLTPSAVKHAAWGALLAAFCCGAYLTWAIDWRLAAFMVTGGAVAVFYTSHLARWALGELAAGTTLGAFVVMGTYLAQAGTLPAHVALLSIPPGLLTALLLLLNELPDAEADQKGGRRHLVILLGRRGATVLYALGLVLTYSVLGIGVVREWFPTMVLLALLTIPLALKALITTWRHHAEHTPLIPALGANVMVVLGTDLLIAVAYAIELARP